MQPSIFPKILLSSGVSFCCILNIDGALTDYAILCYNKSMGYIFLFLSVISGSIKGFFGKKISDKTSDLKSAVFANLIRMLLCIPIGLLFISFDGSFADLAVSGEILSISAFAGLTTSIFIVSWLLAVKNSAFTAVDTFVAMGILVPIVLSTVFYQESVTLSQIIGLLLLFAAVMIMSAYNNQIKQKLSVSALLLLLIVGLANGLTDFSYKLFQYNQQSTPASVFNFYIYVFSAITLFGVFILLHLIKTKPNEYAETEKKPPLLDKRKACYIAIMALFLFCNSYFKTLASNYLTAVQIYPLAQGTAIIFTLLMSTIFFKEKIKPLCIVGLLVLFTALLLLNVVVF